MVPGVRNAANAVGCAQNVAADAFRTGPGCMAALG